MVNLEAGRVFVSTADGGNVAQTQIVALHVDIGIADGLYILQSGAKAHVNARAIGADGTTGCHGAALGQGFQNLLRVELQVVQLGFVQIDKNTFALLAQNIDLLDAGDLQ